MAEEGQILQVVDDENYHDGDGDGDDGDVDDGRDGDGGDVDDADENNLHQKGASTPRPLNAACSFSRFRHNCSGVNLFI